MKDGEAFEWYVNKLRREELLLNFLDLNIATCWLNKKDPNK